MTTVRSVRDDVQNVLDFLTEAELSLYTSPVTISHTRVTWHAETAAGDFILNYEHSSVEQFVDWIKYGQYSCVLFDGSLLQITYEVVGGEVSGHRLAYVPCPVSIDLELLRSDPIADVIELQLEFGALTVLLKSPVRFDFDPRSGKPGHPSAHLTVNSSDCRIACVAPMHVGRFIDFVFRAFHPGLREVHSGFFESAAHRQLGRSVIVDDDRARLHVIWPLDKLSVA